MSSPARAARSRAGLLRRLVRNAPVQERYGPSLPQLLAPRIDRLPAIARRIGAVLLILVAVVIVAIVLRTHNPVYSHPAPLAFATTYPSSLTREPAPRGALLALAQRDDGRLIASFEITPLHLPAYGGEISGLLPVIAINYERRLAAQIGPTFVPWSLGRTRIINTPAFTFTYERQLDDTTYFGRVTFITPNLTGDREGVIMSMLTDPSTLDETTEPAAPTPDAVGTGGVLLDPYEQLHFT